MTKANFFLCFDKSFKHSAVKLEGPSLHSNFILLSSFSLNECMFSRYQIRVIMRVKRNSVYKTHLYDKHRCPHNNIDVPF